MYAATRRVVLKGADALVFVANSASDRWEENIQSFREMTQNLLVNQLDPSGLPLVLQYNKRDLPQITSVEIMDRALNARNVDAIPAVAVRAEGVLETFSAILHRTMQDLSSRYQIVDTGKGQSIQQWVRQTITGMFGTTALAGEPSPVPAEPHVELAAAAAFESPAAPPAPPAERRTVRVSIPEELVRRAEGLGPDARANETLVESYAQASSQLSGALEGVREERDSARRRLEDMQAGDGRRDVPRRQPSSPPPTVLDARNPAGAATPRLLPDAAGGRAVALLDSTRTRCPGRSGVRHVATRFLEGG
jgi:hypothetical protein